MSKHWREKYHIPWTYLPQAHLEVFQLCLWPSGSYYRQLKALVENVFVLSMPVRLGTLDILQRCALQIYILLLLPYLCRHWHTAVDEKREWYLSLSGVTVDVERVKPNVLLLVSIRVCKNAAEPLNWRDPWKNRIYWYISFFCPSLNRVLFPMFCLLVEGECQILVF